MSSTHRNTMYEGILVVDAYYDKIEKLMKKRCQNCAKIDAKIDILAIRGPTFEILGHVFLKTFFYNLLGTQKSTKNRKKAAQKRKKAAKDIPKAKF